MKKILKNFLKTKKKWLEMEGVTKEEKEEKTQDEDLNSLGYLNALIKKLKVFDYFIEIIKHHILLYISQQTFPNSKTCQSPCHPKFSTFGGILLCAILSPRRKFLKSERTFAYAVNATLAFLNLLLKILHFHCCFQQDTQSRKDSQNNRIHCHTTNN